jgi:hypothetical protein
MMVVRLKDLNNEQEKPRGLVRLSDLQPAKPQVNTDTRGLVSAMQSGVAPSLDVRKSKVVQDIESAPTQQEKEKPALYRVQKAIYDKTLGPLTDAALRVASNVADPFHITRGIAEREGVDLRANPIFQGMSAPESTSEKVTDVVGQIAGTVGPGTLAYKTGGKLTANTFARLFPNAPKLAQTAVRGVGAGATFGGAREALEAVTGGEQSLGGRAKDIGLDAAIGGAGDAAFSALAPLASRGVVRLRDLLKERQLSNKADVPTVRQDEVVTEPNTSSIEIEQPATQLPDPNVRITNPTNLQEHRLMMSQLTRDRLEELENSVKGLANPPTRQELFNQAREQVQKEWVEGSLVPKSGEVTPPLSQEKTPQNKSSITQTGLDEAGAKMASGITDNMYAMLWNKVQKGDVTELGQPSAVLQVAKAIRDRGGMSNLSDFKAMASEVQAIRNKGITGKQYQDELQGVVAKYSNPQSSISSPHATQEPTIAPQTEAVSRPQKVDTVPNERGLVTTLRQSGKLTDEVQRGIEASPTRAYEPITNQGTVDAATQRIGRGVDAAEEFSLGGGRNELNAEQVATGFRLIDQFQRSGQIERAVTMAERLAERLTQAGQSIQAASIWNRLTPEGAFVAAQRIVNRVNDKLPKNAKDVTLDTKTGNDIRNAAAAIQSAGESQQRAGDVIDILDRMKTGAAVSDAEKKAVIDFVQDAKQYMKPEKQPRPARPPKEMTEPRVRDKVVSFLDAQEQAALERIRARKNRLSSTPFDEYADYAVVGASKLAKGAVKFADWSEQMVKEFGESIRPQLANIYNRAQDVVSSNAKRISGETISQAERIAENYVKRNEASLKPDDIQLVRNLAQKVSALSGSAKGAASQDLQAILNSFERAGIGRKVSAVQYISMLLNPVTQVRNIVGNELMYRLERLARIGATPIDWATSKLTGTDRQVTFAKGGWDQFFAPTADYWKGLIEGGRAGWRGVNPEGLTTSYDINGQAFRSKLNPLTYLEKTLGAVMKGFDYASFNRASNQRLREMAYLDAVNKGLKGSEIRQHMDRYAANLDDNIAAIAKDYGKYVTLQDDTTLSRALSSFKRGANKLTSGSKEFGLGSVVLPFAKTPANLLMRAIDYSPLGFAKAIYQTSNILRSRSTDLTRADVIQSVTRALLGSGLGGVGLWLADKGVLRGESAGDRDVRELEKQAGLSQYQLNGSALQRMLGALVTGNLQDVDKAAKVQPGDTFWQYEWAQPTSIPLALGANVIQERQQAQRAALKNEKPEGALKRNVDITFGALNTLLNTSVLQGLQQAFDLPPGEENKFKAVTTNILKQIPGMFAPSTVARINQAFDPAIRETYSPSFMENTLNPSRAKIPGLANDLPQRVDTLGQPQTRLNSFFDTFLSPSQRSQFKPSAEAKLVMDLLSETGDERVAPRAVPKYITGTDPQTRKTKRVDLTGEQLVKYQTIVGQETAKRLGRINSNASTEAKVKAVLKALNDAGEVGRKEMRRELGLR